MNDDRTHAFNEHQIRWSPEHVSRLWDYYSRTPPYSEVYFAKLYGQQILARSGLDLRQPYQVLDFGCGPGFVWEHLSELRSEWRYTGLDSSARSVAETIRKGGGKRLFIDAHQVTSLPSVLPGGAFDVALLIEVVEHLDDAHLQTSLSEVHRLLKPGGSVVVTTPNQEDLELSKRFCPECGAVFHEWQHVRSWSVPAFSSTMAAHGFALRRAETLDLGTPTFGLRGLASLARTLLRAARGEPRHLPHMVAVFDKT
jgi:2-polyprenyl-3-methyl-5-hydroxy-6-metoxy-1,4-benzoquinol methylase